MEYIGDVWVDSGTVWIGDPCYVISKEANNSPDTWSEYCDLVSDKFDGPERFTQPFGPGIGLEIQTTWGDGSYPVHVERNDDGKITKAIIDFDYDDDSEDV